MYREEDCRRGKEIVTREERGEVEKGWERKGILGKFGGA
jgi:hypothetical protein